MSTVHTDIAEEYQALRGGCGLLDYAGVGLHRVSGPGALALLGEACTRPVDFLLEGQVTSALLLTEAGTIVAEVAIHCLGQEYLVETWPAQAEAAGELLSSAASAHDVTVTDVASERAVLAVEGPDSFKIVADLLAFPISSMAFRSLASGSFGDVELLIVRLGVTGEYGYKLHVATDAADALRAELIARGAVPAGTAATDICRMEMRFANLEAESGGQPRTPFDLGLQWMVDFQHDFTGKQALLDAWHGGLPRNPVCWVADQRVDVPEAGITVRIGGTTVGEITHGVHSPRLGHVIGTARIDRAVAASGLKFHLGDADGTEIRTVSAPFLVATSFGVSMS